MKFFLLIPVLVAGFMYCNNTLSEYYKLHRYQGQYLYLKAIKAGTFFGAASFLILGVLHSTVDSQFSSHCTPSNLCLIDVNLSLFYHIENNISDIYNGDINELSFFLIASVLTVLFSSLTSTILNWNTRKKYGEKTDQFYMIKYHNESSLSDNMAARALLSQEPILFTLENNKVYVGLITQLPLPNESNSHEELSFVPLMSGYRSIKKQKAKFHTDYMSDFSDKRKYNDLEIVVKKNKIVSLCHFDMDLYIQLNKKGILRSKNKRPRK